MAYIYIIIPVYNAIKYLQEAVCSVIEQPYKNIKIVLVNDGSTDGSDALCNRIAQKEKRVFVIHQENKGVSAARNKGIEYVLKQDQKAKYIAFLDADDLWVTGTITESLVEKMILEDADIVGFSMCMSNQKASRICIKTKNQNEIIESKTKYDISKIDITNHFATYFYDIRLFEEKGNWFDETCRMNEDMIFLAAMCFCSKKIQLYDDVLYIYRNNRMSVTHSNEYNLNNVNYIPESWINAADRFDNDKCIPKNALLDWKQYCLAVSSLKCLELLGLLAEMGYQKQDIENCFKTKIYFHNINNVNEDLVEGWQKKGFNLYKEGFDNYHKFYSRKRWKRYFRKKILNIKFTREILDVVRYTKSINDIKSI